MAAENNNNNNNNNNRFLIMYERESVTITYWKELSLGVSKENNV
jgi:hypothetical protein